MPKFNSKKFKKNLNLEEPFNNLHLAEFCIREAKISLLQNEMIYISCLQKACNNFESEDEFENWCKKKGFTFENIIK